MPIVPVMAESSPPPLRGTSDPGAPVGPDHIDPELVKLARMRPKVGLITAAGLVTISLVFLIRLGPDRRFATSGPEPVVASTSDILSGKVEADQLVSVTAEPMLSSAIRVSQTPGRQGLRIAAARGTGDRLWVVVSGDGGDPPATAGYVGRLRKLDDLAFATAARTFGARPRPVFATAAAVRAGFATGTVTTVTGETVTVHTDTRIMLEVATSASATIVAPFNERLPDAAAWIKALTDAGAPPTATAAPDAALGQVRFTVRGSVPETTARLEAASLWAARVEPIIKHEETTWGHLRASPPTTLQTAGSLIRDADVELVGIYVSRPIPPDVHVVMTNERPDDYWYVMPITIALAGTMLLFSWALVRAIRRDLLPARAT